MTREEAIKILDGSTREETLYLYNVEDRPYILACAENMALKALKSQIDWIPCDKELPPQPKENPLFENKPLELYLVSLDKSDYPWRAMWNGKEFTDGWNKVWPEAWQPLPESYKGEEEEK